MIRSTRIVAPESSAMVAVRHFGRFEGEVWGGRSNERRRSAIMGAAHLACEMGLRFHEDDLVTLCSNPEGSYRPPAWVAGESFYGLACDRARHGVNRSAAIAYEKFRGRTPWIYRDLDTPSGFRLSIGACIELVKADGEWLVAGDRGWGESLDITSFNDEKDTLVACSYHERPEGSYENKVKRRVTVTREMLTVHNRTIAGLVEGLKRKNNADGLQPEEGEEGKGGGA